MEQADQELIEQIQAQDADAFAVFYDRYRTLRYYDQVGSETAERGRVNNFHVLARARRAQHPGIALMSTISSKHSAPRWARLRNRPDQRPRRW
jgi:hypothetical protein